MENNEKKQNFEDTNSKEVLWVILYGAIAFIALAIILNVNTGSNLMFLANPRNIPIPLLTIIYNASHFAYTAVMVIAHLSIGLIVLIISDLHKWILNRKKLKSNA